MVLVLGHYVNLGLELGLRFVLSNRDPIDINLPGKDNTGKKATEDEMEVAKVLFLHHFPLKGNKKSERDKSNEVDFTLEPGSELEKRASTSKFIDLSRSTK